VPVAIVVTVSVPLVASVELLVQPEVTALEFPVEVQFVVLTDDQVIEVVSPAGIVVTPNVSVGAPGGSSASAASA